VRLEAEAVPGVGMEQQQRRVEGATGRQVRAQEEVVVDMAAGLARGTGQGEEEGLATRAEAASQGGMARRQQQPAATPRR
jgi:hypothetical protein